MGGNDISFFQLWVPWPRAVISELSLVAYVHMSKWVAILMLRICYKYIFGNICVNVLNKKRTGQIQSSAPVPPHK